MHQDELERIRTRAAVNIIIILIVVGTFVLCGFTCAFLLLSGGWHL